MTGPCGIACFKGKTSKRGLFPQKMGNVKISRKPCVITHSVVLRYTNAIVLYDL
jgi:hypothetical protein